MKTEGRLKVGANVPESSLPPLSVGVFPCKKNPIFMELMCLLVKAERDTYLGSVKTVKTEREGVFGRC